MSPPAEDQAFYAKGIGSILSNFQSLEFAIRVFLLEAEQSAGHDASFSPVGLHLDNHAPINAFTNHDTLAPLIYKYNRRVKTSHPTLHVDPGLVDLRNAIAHGRVSALQPGFPLLLLNFGPHRNGRVRVTQAEEINKDWLNNQTHRVFSELMKVVRAGQSMGMVSFPRE